MTEPIDARGLEVKCSTCGRRYICSPGDDFYDSTTLSDGVCFECLLARHGFKAKPPTTVFLGGEQVTDPMLISAAERVVLMKQAEVVLDLLLRLDFVAYRAGVLDHLNEAQLASPKLQVFNEMVEVLEEAQLRLRSLGPSADARRSEPWPEDPSATS